MPEVRLVYTAAFIADLADVDSPAMRTSIDDAANILSRFPELGSPLVRESVVAHYGPRVRMLVIAPYLVIYSYDGERVCLLGLVYGPSVR